MADTNAKAGKKGKASSKNNAAPSSNNQPSGAPKGSPILRVDDMSVKPVSGRQRQSQIILDIDQTNGHIKEEIISAPPQKKAAQKKSSPNADPEAKPNGPPQQQKKAKGKSKGVTGRVVGNMPQKVILIMTTSKELSDTIVAHGDFTDHSGAKIHGPIYYDQGAPSAVMSSGLKGKIMMFVGSPTMVFPHTYLVYPVCVYRGNTAPIQLLSASEMTFAAGDVPQHIPDDLLPSIYAAGAAKLARLAGKKIKDSSTNNNNDAEAAL
jgi:hypothetical protein